MDSSITSKTIIAQVLPGIIFVIIMEIIFWPVLISKIKEPLRYLDPNFSLKDFAGSLATLLTALTFIFGLFFGMLFDAIRHCCERFFDIRYDYDGYGVKWWDFFMEGKKEDLDRFDYYYYCYYQLDCNFVISILLIIMAVIFSAIEYKYSMLTFLSSEIFLFIILYIFLKEAILFRRIMRRLASKKMELI